MALQGTDPESYITEYTLVYEDKTVRTIIWSWLSGKTSENLNKLLPFRSKAAGAKTQSFGDVTGNIGLVTSGGVRNLYGNVYGTGGTARATMS